MKTKPTNSTGRRSLYRARRKAKLAEARLIGVNMAAIPPGASIGRIQDFINQKRNTS